MPSIGTPELILILAVVLVLFGFKRLPDAARSLGRSMRIFKAEVDEMKHDKPSAASRSTVRGETVPPQAPPAAQTMPTEQATYVPPTQAPTNQSPTTQTPVTQPAPQAPTTPPAESGSGLGGSSAL